MTQHRISLVSAAWLLAIVPAVSAGVLNDYNPYNIPIPDNGVQACSDLLLSGAPSCAKITDVTVYYEVRHSCPWDLDVWLTAYYNGGWHDYYLYHHGDLTCADDIVETRNNLSAWDGASPNQTWYLCVQDRVTGYTGYIDFFELWVTYGCDPPVITNQPDAGTICAGQSHQFCVTATGCGLEYQWVRAGHGHISGATSRCYPTGVAGNYACQVEVECGALITSSYASLTVNSVPSTPSSASASPNPACAGDSVTLTASGGSGGTYKWYKNGCGSGGSIGSGSSITVIAPSSDTTYYVRRESSCGNSGCASVTLNVTPPPTAPSSASASPNPACAGDSVTLSASGGSGGTFTWYENGCGGSPIGTGSSITVTALWTTTYFVRRENSCGNSSCRTVMLQIGHRPSPPTSASASPNPACAGQQVTLSVTCSSGTPAWYTDGCGSGPLIGTGSSITITALSSDTTYYVRCEGPCGNSVCASVTLIVIPPPSPPTWASVSPDPACAGDSVTLSASGGSGGTLTWYKSGCGSGGSIGTGSSITITAPSSSRTYYVRREGSCGNSSCASVTVTVKSQSSAPTGVSASPSSVCSGGSSTLTKQGGSLGTGASWKWYRGSCGGTPAGTGSSITVSPSSTTTYYVRAEGDCNTTSCASVTVTVKTQSSAPSGASANPTSICSGDSSTLTKQGGSLGTGASWKWYRGSCGGTSAGTGSSITVSPSSTTTYYVRAEGDCNTTSCASVNVAIVSTVTWYRDNDGDGFGTPSDTSEGCDQPSGYVSNDDDCDDNDSSRYPGAPEVCEDGIDSDCDGDDPACPVCDDVDGDGFCPDDGDCNDADGTIYPGAPELCDGKDNDCDGQIDEEVPTWYRDADGDGFGNPNASIEDCNQPVGYVTKSDDCDDNNAAVNPEAPDCSNNADGIDNNCNGLNDEQVCQAPTWYRDTDGDGYGNPTDSTTAVLQPAGFVADNTDCDDSDSTVNPGASEVCDDSKDNDCDGQADCDDILDCPPSACGVGACGPGCATMALMVVSMWLMKSRTRRRQRPR